jgi:hypothetical protein
LALGTARLATFVSLKISQNQGRERTEGEKHAVLTVKTGED